MPGQKRTADQDQSTRKAKKAKTALDGVVSSPQKSALSIEEVDFPRGGGTILTPSEIKTIRANAIKEADSELFKESKKTDSKGKRKHDTKSGPKDKGDVKRIEHLNYKRITIGMKILGQIISIQPLALVVSLPNQLFGHIPITQISDQLTGLLEAGPNVASEDSEDDEDAAKASSSRIPELSEIFKVGQYVRAVVTTVHAAGSTDTSILGRTRDDSVKASRRVELSLVPVRVNAGVNKSDLRTGFTLTASIKSVEDHGYLLDLGISDTSGFLLFEEAKKGRFPPDVKLHVGRIIDVSVTKISSNGRTCTMSVDPALFASSSLSEINNVTSVLPGTLVQTMITAISPDGVNLQALGYFDGTVEQMHMSASAKRLKVGKKIKARVLYDIPGTPPSFVLAFADHIVGLKQKRAGENNIRDSYPIGTILEHVRVISVEPERGVVVEIEPEIEGFIHISHLSDDHVTALARTSGDWKVESQHRARVTGYFMFDGLLQLSLRPTVLEQKFLQVADVQVGELVVGTIKSLTESGLFVTLSGTIDGVVWPNHYADIVLKHPGKRFKPGANIKCRVLAVNTDRKRISLTAKKSLLESTLPILTTFEDAQVGVVTNAVVFKTAPQGLQIEFYNNLKAFVPIKETSESVPQNLAEAFPVGKTVKVRITYFDSETSRVTASIRQAASNYKPPNADVNGVSINDPVVGKVLEIHKEHLMLSLKPSKIRALIFMVNLAKQRGVPVAQLKASLKIGDKFDNLVVTACDSVKGFVVVHAKQQSQAAAPTLKGGVTMDTVEIGQIVGGRVTRHGYGGAHIKLSTRIVGILHPTDTSDNFDAGIPFPAIDSIVKAVVVGIGPSRNQLALSTRHSRLYPEEHKSVIDKEIVDRADLSRGDTVRGFVKSVAEHGLFVTIGRDIDARVQIRELFDEFIKDWKPHFKSSQLVKGRILNVDLQNKKVEMTFKSGDLSKQTDALSGQLDSIYEGEKLDGRIKAVKDYGLFIEIDGTKLSGLCHVSELSDNKDADSAMALRGFREGDRIRAVILAVDREKRKISFGLKPSYFIDDDFVDEADRDIPSDRESHQYGALSMANVNDDIHQHDESARIQSKQSSLGGDGSEDDSEDGAMVVDGDIRVLIPAADSLPPMSRLRLSRGFQWSAVGGSFDHQSETSSSEAESEDGGQPKKKKRPKKVIEQDLTADMHTRTPQSNADFERLLLGSPNSSYLWIQFISFQLQISEIEKARQVGQRAIQSINFREEQERLNVWIALLNLENVYGTDDTMEMVFRDAVRHCDAKTVYLRLASIYDQSGKHEKAEEQYKRTGKKFSRSSKVWTLWGEHYYRQKNLEEARKLLPRCLQSLEVRKHLKTISRFAQMEYKLGDPERGKTIFEGIIDSHPKRWDLWSIYMDMEVGEKDIQSVRNLFQRVFLLKMTSHKAKSFFKRWLSFEKSLGDEEGVAIVKQTAIEWTQKAGEKPVQA